MKFTQAVLPLALAGAALAAPTRTSVLKPRSSSCDSFASVVTGSYTMYQNLWGASSGTGSQCMDFGSLSGETVSWSTSWSWSGGSSSVKSYDNVALTDVGMQISSISSIPAVWDWSYTGSSIVADVSWDLFTSSSASGDNEFEIMVWLSALGGAGPISSTGSSIATATIAGQSFDLYSGPNGDTTVYSFVASGAPTSGSFSGDLNEFFTYLIDNEGFSSSQYLTVLEAGTEPFTGSDAVFTVSSYSVSVSQGSSSTVSSAVSSTVASSTAVAVASTTSASSTYVAPTTSSVAVVPTVASSSSVVIAVPTTLSSAVASPTSTQAAVAPSVTSSSSVSAPAKPTSVSSASVPVATGADDECEA